MYNLLSVSLMSCVVGKVNALSSIGLAKQIGMPMRLLYLRSPTLSQAVMTTLLSQVCLAESRIIASNLHVAHLLNVPGK